uniref:Uncharacterized protein n=1 Tax=Anguilla anguilla TaxID=7936 RepID=A0A0E9TM20_ANGAN
MWSMVWLKISLRNLWTSFYNPRVCTAGETHWGRRRYDNA